MDVLQIKITNWKSKLIDLSKRNRLLNFKPDLKSVLKLDNCESATLFSRLHAGEESEVRSLIRADKIAAALKRSPKNAALDERQLQLLAKESTEKRINDIRLKGKTAIDEKGINTLYAVFGVLRWKEVEYSEDEIQSPLIMMPISLYRNSSNDPFYLEKQDDDPILNPVLVEKLRNDFGIDIRLELDDDKEVDDSLESLLSQIQAYVRHLGFTVTDESFITNLSFNKLVMYRDLERYSPDVQNHPFLQRMVGIETSHPTFNEEGIEPIREHDRHQKSMHSYQVLDSDSSQQEAILASKKGLSFVMQGPPGTGKSQTITNMIAECLAAGKKILFVSDKMAALNVVKNRLDAQGLGAFCLELHSHNANKKSVLEELGKALEFKSKKTPEVPFDHLDDLKHKLNTYVDLIHTRIEPMGMTPYQAHAQLAKLSKVTEFTFKIPEIHTYENTKLSQIKHVLDEIEKLKEYVLNFENHIWKDTIVNRFSYQLQSDITAKFNEFIEKLEELLPLSRTFTATWNLPFSTSVDSVSRLLLLDRTRRDKPDFPYHWLEQESIATDAERHLVIDQEEMESYLAKLNHLTQSYQEEVLDLPIQELAKTLSIAYEQQVEHWTTLASLVEQVEEVLPLLQGSLESIRTYLATAEQHEQQYGFHKDEIERYRNFSTGIQELPRPSVHWFENDKRSELLLRCTEAKTKSEDLDDALTKLLERYEPDVLNLEIEEMLASFADAYTGFFNRLFKSGFREDRKKLQYHMKQKDKTDHFTLLQDLKLAAKIRDIRKWFTEQTAECTEWFGEFYKGERTEWNLLSQHVQNLFRMVDENLITEEGRIYLLELRPGDAAKLAKTIEEMIQQRQQAFDSLHNLESFAVEVGQHPSDAALNLPDLLEAASGIHQAKATLLAKRKHSTKFSYLELMGEVRTIAEIADLRESVERKHTLLANRYPGMYEGTATHWAAIRDAIKWLNEIKTILGCPLPSTLLCLFEEANEQSRKEWEKTIYAIDKLFNLIYEELEFFFTIFPEDFRFPDGKSVGEQEPTEWIHALHSWVDNSYKIEDWLTFKSLLQQAEELNISSFIQDVLEKKYEGERYRDLFLKRFYKLWLDFAYSKVRGLDGFRKQQHEELIQKFKQLDRMQLQANSQRILKTLELKKNVILNRDGILRETGTLRRELLKKRAHLPVRKLFAAIPNLVFALKPCMMMSPMSVSQFIDPQVLRFDLVIFDEASQLGSEDAVGAIFRGDQVIVAGDSKQLPPTRFFSSQSDEDEEEEEEFGVYESILDESTVFLPERSLKWHYRSKHESLISFSNRYLYKNSLHTFPNAGSGSTDGVCLVHVPDGIYDGGKDGSRTNEIEAKKVAELVLNHFQTNPHRSLGVIAFSEAQQEKIREELEAARLQFPELEPFFNEDKEDPFFIKNLENVQGDERDTIFLSVGYAKNPTGKLLYNFGPLSKEGGERRLNVAVTRAKYELKLISSLRHLEIDEEKVSKQGPKLLKRYLHYAETGGAFDFSDDYHWDGEFDSPLEEDVYESLRAAGLLLRPQVGMSGYRIDFGVVDPEFPGRYLLGIEFDGASYHSSKTARDRDRLRQEILEGLGWKFYRIWSQDWFKRKNEIIREIVDMCKQA